MHKLGYPIFIWEQKIKYLKVILKQWAKQKASNIKIQDLNTTTSGATPHLQGAPGGGKTNFDKYHKAIREEEEEW